MNQRTPFSSVLTVGLEVYSTKVYKVKAIAGWGPTSSGHDRKVTTKQEWRAGRAMDAKCTGTEGDTSTLRLSSLSKEVCHSEFDSYNKQSEKNLIRFWSSPFLFNLYPPFTHLADTLLPTRRSSCEFLR